MKTCDGFKIGRRYSVHSLTRATYTHFANAALPLHYFRLSSLHPCISNKTTQTGSRIRSREAQWNHSSLPNRETVTSFQTQDSQSTAQTCELESIVCFHFRRLSYAQQTLDH